MLLSSPRVTYDEYPNQLLEILIAVSHPLVVYSPAMQMADLDHRHVRTILPLSLRPLAAIVILLFVRRPARYKSRADISTPACVVVRLLQCLSASAA